MINGTKDWTDALREALQLPDSPLKQRNGQWLLRDRKSAWFASGPRIFDSDLERLMHVAVEVLSERDPQFDLEPEERFAARIHDKVPKHSRALRDGLAETLALLGAFPEALTNASFGKAAATAVLAVRGILGDADWQLWASLSSELPLLAEAAPEEFLGLVESALQKKPSAFIDVFAQEGGGVLGRTYITGLLWALEGLAWSPDYLNRVVVALGGLAAIDPGGQWSNRPNNSLVEILLPWLPHTTATAKQRVSAVKSLLHNHPTVGWNLLLSLLPNSHRTSSETHRPTWRNLIPETWEREVTNKEYWEQSETYAGLALSEARTFDRLTMLVRRVADFPRSVRDQLLERLRGDEIGRSAQERQAIWSELISVTTRHKKFATAEWAIPMDQIAELESTAELFKPESPFLEYKRLFGRTDFEFYDDKTDFQEQERRLGERRVKAAEAVFAEGGLPRLLEFGNEVETPGNLGLAVGRSDLPVDADLLPEKLTDASTPESDLIRGFVWARFHAKGWQWIDQFRISDWTDAQRADLFSLLPFGRETWERAEAVLPDQGRLFWTRTDASPYRAQTGLDHAIVRLVENGRPTEAIACLRYQIYKRQGFDETLAIRALRDVLKHQDAIGKSLDIHDVLEVIKALQSSPRVNPEELYALEWSYLPLLDEFSGGSPVFLSKRLSSDPAFFCEVIRSIYRSKDVSEEVLEHPDEGRKRVAEFGYKLLHRWHRPPGQNDDGTFSGEDLRVWVREVERQCSESGHLEIAQTHIGHVLMHSPADPSGLWIHRTAAEILNAENAEDMRSGYHCEWFNARGAYWGSGGKEEQKLAANFKQKAADVEAEGFIRLGTALRRLANTYEHEAAREAAGGFFDQST